MPSSTNVIRTKEQARALAIQWQDWQAEQALSWGEVAEWSDFFRRLTDKFPSLTDEFQENGII